MPHLCPDEETLAAYFDGLLHPTDEAALHRELIGCPDCARLVATLGLVIESEAPDAWHRASAPEAVTQRAVGLVPEQPRLLHLAARWIDRQLAPLAGALVPLQLAPSATRAGAPAQVEELRYHVTVADLPLEIDLELDGPEQFALTIRPLQPPPTGLLLRLSAQGETRALSTLNHTGATVTALPTGDYDLTVERADEPLGHLTLSLQGADLEPS